LPRGADAGGVGLDQDSKERLPKQDPILLRGPRLFLAWRRRRVGRPTPAAPPSDNCTRRGTSGNDVI